MALKTLVVIPTYNEAANIGLLIDELLTLPLPLQILVVDDHSPDGTGAIIDDYAGRTPAVAAIHRPRKMGLGTAYAAGFRLALERGFERVITMDADFSHDPGYVPQLVELADSCDLSIGSRYVPGGGVRLWSVSRRALSRGANAFARAMLGLHTRDCTAGFRCYRADVLRAIDPQSIKADGYSYLVEMLWRVENAGFRVGETPIIFTDRRRGASKISRGEIAKAAGTVLRLALTHPPALPIPSNQ